MDLTDRFRVSKLLFFGALALMALSSYFVAGLPEVQTEPVPFSLLVACFYVACVAVPEITCGRKAVEVSACLYGGSLLFIPLGVCLCYATAVAAVYDLFAGVYLYPIPLYILCVKRGQGTWAKVVAVVAAGLYAILHLLLWITCLMFGGWHELAI